MKRFLLLLALAAIPAGAQTLGTDTKISTSWTQPAGYSACSSTLTKGCILGYTETIMPPAAVTTGNIVIAACTLTNTAGCIGAQSVWTWTSPTPLSCGTWSVTVATNYLDGNGTAGVSAPSSAVSLVEPCPFVHPSAPSNISAKPQP